MKLQVIQNKIYEIRDRRVMLDFDLAALYQVETRALKQAVRRNAERFPEDFMFQLSKREWDEVITNCDNLPETMKYSPATPFAFTQEGVAMLSGVLRSPVAVQVNIEIMRAFVAMRQYIATTATITAELAEIRAKLELLERNDEDNIEAINNLSEDVRKDIDILYTAITEMSSKPAEEEKPRRRIGYRLSRDEE
jgi:hypothetical protein